MSQRSRRVGRLLVGVLAFSSIACGTGAIVTGLQQDDQVTYHQQTLIMSVKKCAYDKRTRIVNVTYTVRNTSTKPAPHTAYRISIFNDEMIELGADTAYFAGIKPSETVTVVELVQLKTKLIGVVKCEIFKIDVK